MTSLAQPRPASPTRHAVYLLCLALVTAVFFYSSRKAATASDALIAALGFLLLAGTLLSELLALIRLPHLTGYLLAGLLSGPHLLGVVDGPTVNRLAPVNTLALALIALAGGAELQTDQLRKGLRSLALSTLIHSAAGTVVIGACFFALQRFIPFTAALETSAVIAVSLFWGVLGVSRSPSATLGILAQTKAKGPVASFALAFVMTSDVVVILLMALAMLVAKPLLEPGAPFSLATFHALGHEILGSVSIGTALGVILILYLKLVGRQSIVVLVALGFGATEIPHYLHFDPLLTFLVAGFIVQNLSSQGHKFLQAIDGMGSIVYVVFFASAGADLDIPLLVRLWPVALALSLARAAVTVGSARVSSVIAKDPPVLKTWAWAPLIAQAGLTQGLAGIVQREFPSFGSPFRALVMATLAINAVMGPILFKLALDRSRETHAAAMLSDAG